MGRNGQWKTVTTQNRTRRAPRLQNNSSDDSMHHVDPLHLSSSSSAQVPRLFSSSKEARKALQVLVKRMERCAWFEHFISKVLLVKLRSCIAEEIDGSTRGVSSDLRDEPHWGEEGEIKKIVLHFVGLGIGPAVSNVSSLLQLALYIALLEALKKHFLHRPSKRPTTTVRSREHHGAREASMKNSTASEMQRCAGELDMTVPTTNPDEHHPKDHPTTTTVQQKEYGRHPSLPESFAPAVEICAEIFDPMDAGPVHHPPVISGGEPVGTGTPSIPTTGSEQGRANTSSKPPNTVEQEFHGLLTTVYGMHVNIGPNRKGAYSGGWLRGGAGDPKMNESTAREPNNEGTDSSSLTNCADMSDTNAGPNASMLSPHHGGSSSLINTGGTLVFVLAFTPHAPRSMYHNLISSNWKCSSRPPHREAEHQQTTGKNADKGSGAGSTRRDVQRSDDFGLKYLAVIGNDLSAYLDLPVVASTASPSSLRNQMPLQLPEDRQAFAAEGQSKGGTSTGPHRRRRHDRLRKDVFGSHTNVLRCVMDTQSIYCTPNPFPTRTVHSPQCPEDETAEVSDVNEHGGQEGVMQDPPRNIRGAPTRAGTASSVAARELQGVFLPMTGPSMQGSSRGGTGKHLLAPVEVRSALGDLHWTSFDAGRFSQGLGGALQQRSWSEVLREFDVPELIFVAPDLL